MSHDTPEPAPALEPEDIALAASLRPLRPQPLPTRLLNLIISRLECSFSDHTAAQDTGSPSMPLDSSLLAFEKELRSLRPMEMDFPTGQQVWRALEREMSPASAAPPALHLLEGTKPTASAATHSKWNHLSPWAAAAALVLASWIALPHLPHRSTTIAAATETAKAGLIPYADRTSEKGSVAQSSPSARNSLSSATPPASWSPATCSEPASPASAFQKPLHPTACWTSIRLTSPKTTAAPAGSNMEWPCAESAWGAPPVPTASKWATSSSVSMEPPSAPPKTLPSWSKTLPQAA